MHSFFPGFRETVLRAVEIASRGHIEELEVVVRPRERAPKKVHIRLEPADDLCVLWTVRETPLSTAE